ncbi:MAG: hypothetical protein H6712_11990 [Myxococcales bacterium]|nr:hypothetical protein [Myxococcales bacterium]MCB9714576.1 hypothetical protein [Myxococcales bacterium]
MKRRNLVLASALFAVVATACDADALSDHDLDQASFRAGGTADGNLSVFPGTDTSNPAGTIWEFVDDDVSSGPSYGGGLILTVVGDEIYDAEGELRCSRAPVGTDGSNLLEELRDGTTGDVHYTVMGKWVFYGRQDLPNPDFSQLAFTLKGSEIYEGSHTTGDVLVTATKKVEQAGDMRKLTLAALIDGHCGAPGL